MLGGVTPHDSNEFMAEAIASTGDFWKHPEEDNTARASKRENCIN
jgi:hypothetical protein